MRWLFKEVSHVHEKQYGGALVLIVNTAFIEVAIFFFSAKSGRRTREEVFSAGESQPFTIKLSLQSR